MLPASTINRTTDGSYELTLQGHISHPHWVAFLFAGLAEAKVSVVSGRVLQNESHDWNASFSLDFRASAANAETLDYVALAARKPASTSMTPLRLNKFTVVRRREGSLETYLDGPDQIGFLGRVLGSVSLLGLFPGEMDIKTVGGVIQDRIVFHGIGGAAPGEPVRESLIKMLDNMASK